MFRRLWNSRRRGAEKTGQTCADLKLKSEKSSYARDRLANIYFLAGDRAQFEKLYGTGKLNLYEKQFLLSYWLYGAQNVYKDTLPDSFFSSPNRAKAVKLMEEIAPVDAEVFDSTTTVMLIYYYAKIGDSEKLSQALKKFLPKIPDSGKLGQIAKC